MVPEAKLTRTDAGLVPKGEGWYVLNAKDAVWDDVPGLGRSTGFEGDSRFTQFGVNIHVAPPGEPNCMYHGEEDQEDFLVLFGECLLIVEGEERRLKAWDFVHCPPWTEHVFVGTGDGPCGILMVGGRSHKGLRYPVNEVAAKHGASVLEETSKPAEAYARFGPEERSAYREGWLP